jgi:hypothetical protein
MAAKPLVAGYFLGILEVSIGMTMVSIADVLLLILPFSPAHFGESKLLTCERTVSGPIDESLLA